MFEEVTKPGRAKSDLAASSIRSGSTFGGGITRGARLAQPKIKTAKGKKKKENEIAALLAAGNSALKSRT
jgi:hypothetical protein